MLNRHELAAQSTCLPHESLRKGQLNRHTKGTDPCTDQPLPKFAKGSVESTHKVPTSHYHTKHCHAAVVPLGGKFASRTICVKTVTVKSIFSKHFSPAPSTGVTRLMGDDGDEARKRMQVKSFTTWVNLHVSKVGMEVKNLTKDFEDGIRLIKLIEVISEESLGKYNPAPKNKFEKVANLKAPIEYINNFLKSSGIKNQYSVENILEENEVLILGMIYSLIMRFAVQHVSEGDRTAKEGLLLWAQKKVEDGSKGIFSAHLCTVQNFHSSWQDGTAFCCLIHAFRPDLIPAEKVLKSADPAKMQEVLNLAFDVADSKLGIPKMLDAADMASHRPDEKSVMTYVRPRLRLDCVCVASALRLDCVWIAYGLRPDGLRR